MVPVLTTKLFMPEVRPGTVERSRLREKLDRALTRKAALVSAPAGFGKSTLVSAWAHGLDLPVAWLSLDESDNEVARFLTYLRTALHAANDALGEDPSEANDLASDKVRIPAQLTPLLNDLAQAETQMVLVLDDLHLIGELVVYEAIQFIIEHQPSQLCLILVTREDPPLPLSRLRVRGSLVEVRAADLRFNHSEAVQFFNNALELELAPEQIAALDDRTEGWVAGLQLAAMALEMTGDDEVARNRFIADFAGDERLVMDYLMDEVLSRQPPEIQRFLLETSLLERLCGPLCDAVTGRDDSQVFLERLERSNALLIPLDHHRTWYRYHHLFADLLRYRLQRTSPEIIEDLHRRAAHWYRQEGWLEETIRHFLAAEAYEQVADLIEKNWETMLLASHTRLYLDAMATLPLNLIRSRPLLCIVDAWAHFLTNREGLEAVERRLNDAKVALAGADERAINPEAIIEIQAHTAALRSVLARLGRRPAERIIELSEQAQRMLPGSEFIEYLTDLNLSSAYLVTGRTDQALRTLRRAYTSDRARRMPYVGITITSIYGEVLLDQGQLRNALALYRDAVETFTDAQSRQRPPYAELVYGGIGRVFLECNDLAAASDMLDHDLSRFPPGDEILETYIHLAHARLCWARGDLASADRSLTWARRVPYDDGQQYVDAFEARMWARRQGAMAHPPSWAWADNVTLVAESVPGAIMRGRLPGMQRTTLVHLWIAQQRGDLTIPLSLPSRQEVFDYLERQRSIEVAGEWWGRVLDLQILQALAHDVAGEPQAARHALAQAVELAAQSDHVRIFVDEGLPMARLLYNLAAQEAQPSGPVTSDIQQYAQRLLPAFELPAPEEAAPTPSAADANTTLIEPLSDRELDVLKLIAEGLTNPEVAQRLYISVHTVKSHASNLYGKLGVSNRTQAVQKAQALGLLLGEAESPIHSYHRLIPP